jgi:hypothetical protein
MFSEIGDDNEIMLKNMIQPDRPQMWYSRTDHRYGTAGQITDMVEPDRPQMTI